MDDRYEIKKKIGQGGLGSVYLAFDTRMNRDVAIKRIAIAAEDPALQAESTKQLLKEAGALASLQHPHIVTIYDVGTDEECPYVVMELISGKTLDEVIEVAPLTWPDFRELAMQTQEALIAAQELSLIHGDIKPGNLMLTWLPSGRFQIKIVDFGLATLTNSQSAEELESLDAVFGSIFFMAPEQFERVPIDARADIYSMACVYYQCLTGIYPFQGETGHDVMVAHLHHQVIPIQDIRAGIPLWICDWIMWQLNRLPADRPESSREALQVFLQNDKNPTSAMSQGPIPSNVPPIPRARLAGAPPTQRLTVVSPAALTLKMTAPQPLLPPEGSKPSVHSSSHAVPQTVPTVEITARSNSAKLRTAPPTRPSHPAQVESPKPNRKARIIVVGLAFALMASVSGLMLVKRLKENKLSQRYSALLAEAQNGSTDIRISLPELNRYLTASTQADTEEKKKVLFTLLAVAKPNDGSDFDDLMVEFATTTTEFLPEDRQLFIQQVVAERLTAANASGLIDFARGTKDKLSAQAAFVAVGRVAHDEHFASMIAVICYHPDLELRKIAETNATTILKKSSNKSALFSQLKKAASETTDKKSLDVLQRLEKSIR